MFMDKQSREGPKQSLPGHWWDSAGARGLQDGERSVLYSGVNNGIVFFIGKTRNKIKQKQEEVMKLRKSAAIVFLMLLASVGVKQAWAINPDQITITIAPTAAMNVSIATTSIQWNSGDTDMDLSLALGTTDYLVKPATVTYTGTFGGAEIDVTGSLSGGWSIDADATAQEDQLQVYALFSHISTTTAPTVPTDYTDGTGASGDQVTTGARRFGQSGGDDAGNDSAFQEASYSGASENWNSGDSKHLWLRMDLPPTSTTGATQTLVVSLTAVSTN